MSLQLRLGIIRRQVLLW